MLGRRRGRTTASCRTGWAEVPRTRSPEVRVCWLGTGLRCSRAASAGRSVEREPRARRSLPPPPPPSGASGSAPSDFRSRPSRAESPNQYPSILIKFVFNISFTPTDKVWTRTSHAGCTQPLFCAKGAVSVGKRGSSVRPSPSSRGAGPSPRPGPWCP